MHIRLARSERIFSAAPGQPVLQAALQAGLNLPRSCLSGNCGACRARLTSGTIAYPNGAPLGLTRSEAEEGFILLCQATAATDLTVDIGEIRFAGQSSIKMLPCRIERAERWSQDVMGVFLRTPAVEPLAFEPGQYVDILLAQGRRRSFSIASPPHDSRLLELHVRRVAGGVLSGPLFEGDLRRSILTIEGPFGTFALRQGSSSLLLVGGGTGLAPLKSILRHVVELKIEREILLYWGVRTRHDLYAENELQAMSRGAGNLRYIPVLSQPDVGWNGRRGFVHEAVLADIVDLAPYEIYASGPPEMIAAVRGTFSRQGALPERLFSDSFDYSKDALDGRRRMASTRS